MDPSLYRLLVEALSEDVVRDGGARLEARSAEDVATVLRIAQERRLPLRLTSGAGDAVAAPERGAVLSLAGLDGIAVDPQRGLVRAEAGATLTELHAALAAAGTAVPGLAPEPGSDHVGGLIARGQLARRSLTGVEAVLPGGDAVMVGAAVLKDVVGYDVISLLLGSRGRLAAVVAAHLRLVPAGAAVEVAEPSGTHSVTELGAVFDPEGILVGD